MRTLLSVILLAFTVTTQAAWPTRTTFDAATNALQGQIDTKLTSDASTWRTIHRGAVSVKDPPFNATGDGVTDDTAAFQAAFNAATNLIGTVNGPTIQIPTGVYKLTNTITLQLLPAASYGAVTIVGAGNGTTRIEFDKTDRPLFHISSSAYGGFVSGIAFIGPATNATVTTNSALMYGYARRNAWRDCRFDGWGGSGIYIDDADGSLNSFGLSVENSIFNRCYLGGIGSETSAINQITIGPGVECNNGYAATLDTNSFGVRLPGVNNLTLLNAIIENCGYGLYIGVDASVNNITCINTYFENNGARHILIEDLDTGSLNIVKSFSMRGGYFNNTSMTSPFQFRGHRYQGFEWINNTWASAPTLPYVDISGMETGGNNFTLSGEDPSTWSYYADWVPALLIRGNQIAVGTTNTISGVGAAFGSPVGQIVAGASSKDTTHDWGTSANRWKTFWGTIIDSGANSLTIKTNPSLQGTVTLSTGPLNYTTNSAPTATAFRAKTWAAVAADGTAALMVMDGNGLTNRLSQPWAPSAIQTITAGGAITANAQVVKVVGNAGAVDTSAVTAIADNNPGKPLTIIGTDDTNTVTVKDGANTSLGADRVLGAGDVLALIFDDTSGLWLQVSYADN